MQYYEVAPTKIIRDGIDTFTYHSEQPLGTGQVVEIPAGRRQVIGVVMCPVKKPDFATKPITTVLDTPPLPTHLVELAQWMSSYYAAPLALTFQTILPRGIDKKRRNARRSENLPTRKRTTFVLNDDQRMAVDRIASATGTVLLHGVTGSGKTAVYIEAAKRTLTNGKSVIILVPEIALTSQLVAEFSQHFPSILLTHSRQTEAQRHLVWQAALTADTPQVVIGPRSALFMPLASPGLIVIDECHEPSFQQEQTPRYSALRVAATLARLTGGGLVLGSATPLVSDYFLAASEESIISLPRKADKDAIAPTVSVVDMTKRDSFKKHRFFSDRLLGSIEETLANDKQVLLFHNRRGSASVTLCEQCGWQAGCPRCYTPLTLHADAHHLRCHICGYHSRVPTSCPECHHADIIHKGIGTKLIESELIRLFPSQSIARFDGDGDDASSVEARYQELYDGTLKLIIGTQVVAKGLDLPHLRTVGIVQADAGLSLPDYSAAERTFQLLSQVVGRVGRTHHATNVIVQSYQQSHPAVVDGLAQQYEEFYTRTLALRRHTNFPPFCFLLKLTCIYKTEKATIKHAKGLATTLRSVAPDGVDILGPTPAFYERQRDTYRWQLVIKSPQRSHLLELLTHVPRANWQYELDPISLL